MPAHRAGWQEGSPSAPPDVPIVMRYVHDSALRNVVRPLGPVEMPSTCPSSCLALSLVRSRPRAWGAQWGVGGLPGQTLVPTSLPGDQWCQTISLTRGPSCRSKVYPIRGPGRIIPRPRTPNTLQGCPDSLRAPRWPCFGRCLATTTHHACSKLESRGPFVPGPEVGGCPG